MLKSTQPVTTTQRTTTPQPLSQLLQQRRQELSLFRFSEESSLSTSQWSGFEEGLEKPTETELWRISKTLETPFTDVLLAIGEYNHEAHTMSPHCLNLYGVLLEEYSLFIGEEIDTSLVEPLRNGGIILVLRKNWHEVRIKFPANARDCAYIVEEANAGAMRLLPKVNRATLLHAAQFLADLL